MSSISEEVAALRGTKPATLKDLLTHRVFSKLLAAMSVSSLGDWVGFVAVAALVARLGGNARGAQFAVAGVMVARMLPSVLFGPFAGPIVDRVDRKRLMMGSDVARGLMYASMPFLGHLGAIYVLSFFIECLSLLWTPARDATLPNIVPRRQLANANSVGMMTTYGTLPLGGLIFALLAGLSAAIGGRVPYFSESPESLALWLDSATFFFSALMLSRMQLRTPPAHGGERLDLSKVGRDVVEGFRFLKEHSLAGSMTLGIVVAFSGVGAVVSLGPVFAAITLDAGASGWGILVTTFGIGMLIGLAGVNTVAKVVDRERIFYLAMIGAAATLFVLAGMPNISLAAVFATLLGILVGTTWVTGYVLLQETVADEFRGRTFGALTVMSRLGLFLSLTVFPVLAGVVGSWGFNVGGQHFDLSGTRIALWAAGVAVAAGGLYTRLGMQRQRVNRPQPLGLVPKLKRAPAEGLFIVFEGVEGAGKGTQIEHAKEFLESEGRKVQVTREPGGTDAGERLRDLLLDKRTGAIEPVTEALLFAAARAQLVSTVIRPALEAGNVLLCDRYVDSSLAYQGAARGLGEHDVLTLNVWATHGLFPDLVILLHLEPERGLERTSGDADRFESESLNFHAKVADAYLRIADEHPERFIVIDADRSEAEVQRDVKAAIAKLLPGGEG